MTPEILVRRGLDRGLLAMIVASAVLHVGVVAMLIIMPTRLLGPSSKMESYTVDLVAPDVLGGTNLLAGGGKANAPAKPGPPAPVETKPEPVAVQAPPAPPPQEAPKAAGPPPPEPVKAPAEAKPVEAPPVVEPAKPVEPPKPVQEAVKVEPPPAKPVEAKPPEAKPAENKPVAPPKPAPVAEAKAPQPKSPVKAAEAPKPAVQAAEPPKPAAKPVVSAKPAPVVAAKPAEPPKKPEQAKPAPPRNPVDDEIAAAVQRRAAQVQSGSGGASRDLDKQIAAAVARRAQQAGAGAGAGVSAAGGPISIGPGSGAGGTPAGIDYILYQGKMEQKIKAAWAWAGADKSRVAVIQFNLEPDGQIKNVHTTQSSGDAQYDTSCERAVRAVNPLEPVPERYRKEFATVELTFKPEEVGN